MSNYIVSLIVVALNAENTLNNLFSCFLKQTYNHKDIEILLIDSMSNDKTKELMLGFSKEYINDFRNIKVLENPKKTLPCGWNVALDNLTGDVVLRLDAHITIPNDFIEKNVKNIYKGENISCGKVNSVPFTNTLWNNTINQAENSMFGGGIASFRHAEEPKYVSTGGFAMYKREIFNKVGKYNESLARTEDNEMHYRMKANGYKFYYDPSINSYRYTRNSFSSLVKQKYLNGYWIGRTLFVEPRCFSLYHFVPCVFVIALLITLFLFILNIKTPLLLLLLLYFSFCTIITVVSLVKSENRNILFLLLPLMFFCLHFSYGCGTILGIIKGLFIKKKGAN